MPDLIAVGAEALEDQAGHLAGGLDLIDGDADGVEVLKGRPVGGVSGPDQDADGRVERAGGGEDLDPACGVGHGENEVAGLSDACLLQDGGLSGVAVHRFAAVRADFLDGGDVEVQDAGAHA